jgi:hypothetical protein
MQFVAIHREQSMPIVVSLKVMISRWENDHRRPDPYNCILLCSALGMSASALGLSDQPR